MAITNGGTKNSLSSTQKPSGYSDPTPTTFTDYEYIKDVELSVLKATVENASAATTMAAIISDGTIGISKQALDIVTADFIAASTVDFYTDWIGISHNLASLSGDGTYLKATAMSYLCTVRIYIKSTP